MATVCNDCGTTILYAVHVNDGVGRRIPVDADPHPAGTLLLDWSGTLPAAAMVAGDDREQAVARGDDLYMSHYYTCGGTDAA